MAYFFKWIPVAVIAAIFILSLPWLGLIALIVLLAALAFLLVYLPFRLGRAVVHHWSGGAGVALEHDAL